jgi:hypothetical protein
VYAIINYKNTGGKQTMRIKETKVYQFDELTEKAKEKALEELYDINVDYDWWEGVYEDAKEIGLKLTGFDIDRGSYCKGELIDDLHSVILAIIRNHGKETETYKTAKEFEDKLVFNEDNEIENLEELEDDFLKAICEDYLVMLRNEYEYFTSEEAIVETIRTNEYEFTEDGKLA